VQPYRIFEHTADVGLKIRGRTFRELLKNAGAGFFNLLTDYAAIRREAASGSRRTVRRLLSLKTADPGDLLLAWLRELLFLFSAKKLIFYHYEFLDFSKTKMRVRALGVKFDPSRDEQKLEVKAVTYHHFELKKNKRGWTATVIFDI
jgi:SHS2 domain-containing protein